MLPSATWAAEGTAEEIRLLKARLQQLEAKVGASGARGKSPRRRSEERPAGAEWRAGPGRGPSGSGSFLFQGHSDYARRLLRGGIGVAQRLDGRRRPHALPEPSLRLSAGCAHLRVSDERPPEPRAASRINADINPDTHILGYGEVDFFGAAQTANSNQSNSYNLRLRQAYGHIDYDPWGLHVSAGQMWSLVTMNSVGIRPDTSLQPPTIDAQYLPGYVFARQPGLRVTKDFDKQFWVSFGVESAATTYALPGPVITQFGRFNVPATVNLPVIETSRSCWRRLSAADRSTRPTITRSPACRTSSARRPGTPQVADRTIHIEGFGLLRDMTDRAYWGNHSQWAGGAGAGVVVPVIPKLIDVQLSGMTGRGIGRYGAGQISDATYQLSGAVQPISERIALAGVTRARHADDRCLRLRRRRIRRQAAAVDCCRTDAVRRRLRQSAV